MFKRYINKEDPPFIDALRSYIEGYLAAKKESDDSAEAQQETHRRGLAQSRVHAVRIALEFRIEGCELNAFGNVGHNLLWVRLLRVELTEVTCDGQFVLRCQVDYRSLPVF